MTMGYETFRELEAAFRHYHALPGDWDALIKLNKAFKASGLQDDTTRRASNTIDTITAQGIIEEEEWKKLEVAGLSISLFIEHNLAMMRHHKDKTPPFLDIYEEIQWLRDDLETIKNHPAEGHPALWKQALETARKLGEDERISKEEPILKIALHNIHFIEAQRAETKTNENSFAPYTTLLAQTHKILGNYLTTMRGQGFAKTPPIKKKAA